MGDVCGVHVLQGFQELVEDVLHVLICQVLSRLYDSVQIHLHDVCDQVKIPEIGRGRVIVHIQEFEDVFVIKVSQNAYFPQDSLGIHDVFDSVQFLHGHHFVGLAIDCLDHCAVSADADEFLDGVFGTEIELHTSDFNHLIM